MPIKYLYIKNDKFLLTFSVEGKSNKYDHACVDFLGGVGNTKQQAIYEINLKTKEYKSNL